MKLDLLKKTWLDIVFEGRNKAYGAYELRLTNPKTSLRALLIGGVDGLDEEFKQQADDKLRLSSLTLPHGMARLVLCEQLYRAVSVLKNHPYHREG